MSSGCIRCQNPVLASCTPQPLHLLSEGEHFLFLLLQGCKTDPDISGSCQVGVEALKGRGTHRVVCMCCITCMECPPQANKAQADICRKTRDQPQPDGGRKALSPGEKMMSCSSPSSNLPCFGNAVLGVHAQKSRILPDLLCSGDRHGHWTKEVSPD